MILSILVDTFISKMCIRDSYYNNPLTGTYFRMIRFLCIPVSLLLLPVFLLLSAYYPEITASLQLSLIHI